MLKQKISANVPKGEATKVTEAPFVPFVAPCPAPFSQIIAGNELQSDPLPDTDDRRTCQQCTNLTPSGRCLAAARGELPYVASRRYEPVQDVLRRCEGYAPTPPSSVPMPLPRTRVKAEAW